MTCHLTRIIPYKFGVGDRVMVISARGRLPGTVERRSSMGRYLHAYTVKLDAGGAVTATEDALVLTIVKRRVTVDEDVENEILREKQGDGVYAK